MGSLLRWQFGLLGMMVTRPVKVVQVCDWCISYDLSETIMVLMSAEGLYKKPIFQRISVGASLPPLMAEVKTAKWSARFRAAYNVGQASDASLRKYASI